MANCMVYHTQIASIMEVLANAAVAEICKLVDDDYAVFRLEMSQSQKENRAMRRKLQLLELKMARERAERVLASRPSSVKILDRYRGMAKGTFSRTLRLRDRVPILLCARDFRCVNHIMVNCFINHIMVNQNWVLVICWIICNLDILHKSIFICHTHG